MSSAIYYSQSWEDSALYQQYFSSPQLCNGTYVEIGALDGVKYSNTKFFEDTLDWSGVLIEAQPHNAEKLAKNRPHSAVVQEAVCAENETSVTFAGNGAVGGVVSEMTAEHKKRWLRNNKEVSVPCRPIGRMLREANIKAVDFFVLDVEGAELAVLRTMDWTIPVGVFVVEMGRGQRDQVVIDLLLKHGYHADTWDIRSYCIKGHDCANNKVFENPDYHYQKSKV